jgi:hypothetical protein
VPQISSAFESILCLCVAGGVPVAERGNGEHRLPHLSPHPPHAGLQEGLEVGATPTKNMISYFLLMRRIAQTVHRKKKVREFPVPSRDVTTKLSWAGIMTS